MRVVRLLSLMGVLGTACNHRTSAMDDGSDTSATGTNGTESGESDGTTGSPQCDYPGPNGSCSIWCQDCGEGEKCVPVFSDNGDFDQTRCVEVVENANAPQNACNGNSVTGNDDCDQASICWDVDPGTKMGTCQALCADAPASPVCPGATRCLQGTDALAVCLDTCDPLVDPSCDAEGEGKRCISQDPICNPQECLPMSYAGGLFCVPVPTQGLYKANGDPCSLDDECDFGLFCAPGDRVEGCSPDGSCCASYCDLDGPECTVGTCQPLFDAGAAPVGLDHLGACLSG